MAGERENVQLARPSVGGKFCGRDGSARDEDNENGCTLRSSLVKTKSTPHSDECWNNRVL